MDFHTPADITIFGGCGYTLLPPGALGCLYFDGQGWRQCEWVGSLLGGGLASYDFHILSVRDGRLGWLLSGSIGFRIIVLKVVGWDGSGGISCLS